MNYTLFVGNGFDLNAGLKTRYSDFYEQYCKTQSHVSVDDFKSSIDDYCKKPGDRTLVNWSDAEVGFGQYTYSISGKADPAEHIVLCHDDFCDSLAAYLVEESKRFPYSLTIEDNHFLQQMWNGMISLETGLRPDDSDTIKRYLDIIPGGISVNVITFNYTNVIDRLLEQIEKKRIQGGRVYRGTSIMNHINSVIHVHGTLDHGFALGVNDVTQLNESVFSKAEPEYMNQLIKPMFLKDMGDGVQTKVEGIISSSDVIYIYGMSLGETDRYWWEKIMQQMLANDKMIVIYHSVDVPEVTMRPREYLLYLRKFRNKMISYLGEIDSNARGLILPRIFASYGNIFACLSDVVGLSASL